MPWFDTVARVASIAALLCPLVPAAAQAPVPAQAAQNPSPMLDTAARTTHPACAGRHRAGLPRPRGQAGGVWVPDRARTRDACDVVIHFHGAAWLPEQAVAALGSRTVVAVLNLGAGSGIYDRSFADPAAFDTLLATVTRELSAVTGASTTETADWTVAALGLRRTPVLRWGPRGMQQLSEVHAGRFRVLGFAGTTAPDHMDQLHALPELLKRLRSR